MEFINKGEPVKIRIGPSVGGTWKTVATNERINLDRRTGLRNGFEGVRTTQGQIGDRIVETKQIESDAKYFSELKNINGIGEKTAKDILKVFPIKDDLLIAIRSGKELPFRDDIEEKLRYRYERS